ncbi:hypothetical protein [Methylomagnum sp.]
MSAARDCAAVGGFPARRLAAASVAHGQDLEPRAYVNTPMGLDFLIADYAHMWGGVAFDPAIPLTDAKLQVESAVSAYARSLDVFGRSGKFGVVLPAAWLCG